MNRVWDVIEGRQLCLLLFGPVELASINNRRKWVKILWIIHEKSLTNWKLGTESWWKWMWHSLAHTKKLEVASRPHWERHTTTKIESLFISIYRPRATLEAIITTWSYSRLHRESRNCFGFIIEPRHSTAIDNETHTYVIKLLLIKILGKHALTHVMCAIFAFIAFCSRSIEGTNRRHFFIERFICLYTRWGFSFSA